MAKYYLTYSNVFFAPIGVSALNLCLSNCSWSGHVTVDLYPWDAGTDDALSYTVCFSASAVDGDEDALIDDRKKTDI